MHSKSQEPPCSWSNKNKEPPCSLPTAGNEDVEAYQKSKKVEHPAVQHKIETPNVILNLLNVLLPMDEKIEHMG